MFWRQSLFFLLILLFACKPSGHDRNFTTEPEVNFDLEAIRKRGSLVALLDNNSISYFIYKGQPMGYEYELLKQLAKSLKVDLKIRLVTGIEQAIDLLNKGEGDILAFPLTITAERKQYITFTIPHFDTHQVLVQRNLPTGGCRHLKCLKKINPAAGTTWRTRSVRNERLCFS